MARPEPDDTPSKRKDKSLGLLCENFLRQYARAEGTAVSLDEAAGLLCCERRRIYDVVNVLEGVYAIERRAKNTYVWQGLHRSRRAITRLREEGEQICCGLDSNGLPNLKLPSGDRRERSLVALAERFVQLFIVAAPDFECRTISLHTAAQNLSGLPEQEDRGKMKTKIRRLYDIANIMVSVGFVVRTTLRATGKPAFCWAGLEHAQEHTLSIISTAPQAIPTPEPTEHLGRDTGTPTDLAVAVGTPIPTRKRSRSCGGGEKPPPRPRPRSGSPSAEALPPPLIGNQHALRAQEEELEGDLSPGGSRIWQPTCSLYSHRQPVGAWAARIRQERPALDMLPVLQRMQPKDNVEPAWY